jgi:hypothetical protein
MEAAAPAPSADELRAARERILAHRQQHETDQARLQTKIADVKFHAYMRSDVAAEAHVVRLQAELSQLERQDADDAMLLDRINRELAEADAAAAERERAGRLEQFEALASTVEAIGADLDRVMTESVRPLVLLFLQESTALARHASMGSRQPAQCLAQAVAVHLCDQLPLLRNLIDRRMSFTAADYARTLGVRARNANAPPAAAKGR